MGNNHSKGRFDRFIRTGPRHSVPPSGDLDPESSSTPPPVQHITNIHGDFINYSGPPQLTPDELTTWLEERVRASASKYADDVTFHVELERAIRAVALQISSEVQKSSNDSGHFNKREEIVGALSDRRGDVTFEDIFSRAEQHARTHIPKHLKSERERELFVQACSHVIGLTGQAGIGKTTIAKLVTRCLLDGRVLPRTRFVFNLAFRDVDYDVTMSVLEFLTASSDFALPEEERAQRMMLEHLEQSEDVVIILDGLDEAVCDDFGGTSPKVKLHQRRKAIHILRSLLSRVLLPKARILLTSRPQQLFLLHPNYRPRFVAEVLGMSEAAQRELIEQACGAECFQQVYAYLMEHPDIANLCYVPANCLLIVCCLVKMARDHDAIRVTTITGVMAYALLNYLRGDHVTSDHATLLPNLCLLAWNGIQQRKIVFVESDFQQAGIDPASAHSFLHTYIDQRSSLRFRILDGEKRMSFSHLTWQEFFAAILLMFVMSTIEFQILLPTLTAPQFETVLKFCFGFLNPDVQDQVRVILPLHVITVEKQQLLRQLAASEVITHGTSANRLIAACAWAGEARRDDVTKAVGDNLLAELDIPGTTILPSDAVAFAFVFSRTPRWFDLQFRRCVFIRNAFELFAPSLTSCEIDSPPPCRSSGDSSLERGDDVTHSSDDVAVTSNDQERGDDVTATSTNHRHANTIERLRLLQCQLTSDDVRHLADKLKQLKIPLEELNLLGNSIGDQGAVELAGCVSRVKHLTIKLCFIGQFGVDLLRRTIAQLSTPKPEVIGLDVKDQ